MILLVHLFKLNHKLSSGIDLKILLELLGSIRLSRGILDGEVGDFFGIWVSKHSSIFTLTPKIEKFINTRVLIYIMVERKIRKKVFGINIEPTLQFIIKRIKKQQKNINISRIVEKFLVSYLKEKYPGEFIDYDLLITLDKKHNNKKRGKRRKKVNLL